MFIWLVQWMFQKILSQDKNVDQTSDQSEHPDISPACVVSNPIQLSGFITTPNWTPIKPTLPRGNSKYPYFLPVVYQGASHQGLYGNPDKPQYSTWVNPINVGPHPGQYLDPGRGSDEGCFQITMICRDMNAKHFLFVITLFSDLLVN